jgi:uncharacterized protein with von Willebrand factor type A (vWA) domain
VPGPDNLNDETRLQEWLGVSRDALREMASNPNNTVLDSYDKRTFNDLMKASQNLRNLVEHNAPNGAFRHLASDLWGQFYKADPNLHPAEAVEPTSRPNRPYVERMAEDASTQEARLTTMLDELASALAAQEACQRLASEIQERKELRDAAEKQRQAENCQKQGDQQGAEQAAQEAAQMLQGAARDVRRAVAVAVEAGQQKASDLQTTLAGWGLEGSDLQSVPLGERLTLAERLMTPQMKRLAEQIGRFRNLARARQKNRVRYTRTELHSIELGNDLAHLLPSELAALSDPLRQADFFRRYTDGGLLQYHLQDKERQGRGPLWLVVDKSGSMGGGPMEWAVATAMGLLDTALRQKRPFGVAFFDTRVVLTVEFAPGEKDVNKLLQVATVGAGGGTDYKPALELALAKMQESKYNRADLVMVSDGVCTLPDEFLARFNAAKKQREFRTYSVLLGSDPYGTLKKWSDKVLTARMLTDDMAGEIFEEVF